MRRHGLKKGLSLLLVFCMILSLLPMTALAEEISEPSAAVEEQESAAKDETTNTPDDTTGDKQDDTGEAGSEAGTDEAGSETGTDETSEPGSEDGAGETGSEAGTGEAGEAGTGETGETGTGETGEGEEEKSFVDKIIDEIKDILTPITGEKTEEEKAAEEAAQKAAEEEAAKKAEEEAAQKAAEEAAQKAAEEEAAKKAAEEAAQKIAEEAALLAANSQNEVVEFESIEISKKPSGGTTEGEPFPAGTGGSDNFRIPALVTLSDGTLVAAADARWDTYLDGYGLDTVASYSKDAGKTWHYTFANYLGDNGNVSNTSSTAFIDPCLATDGDTVYMLVDLYPAGGYISKISSGTGFDSDGHLLLKKSGDSAYNYYLNGDKICSADGTALTNYTVDKYFNLTDSNDNTTNLFFSNSPFQVLCTSYLYLTKSTDGGKTWSEPTMLNPQVKYDNEYFYGVGPGRGLVTSTGRIIFPCYTYTTSDGNTSVIYSDDGGETWHRSADMSEQSSEAALVEADGRIYMFTRHGGYYVSEDDGKTWSKKKDVDGISYTTSCQLSAITYSAATIDGKTAILLSAPTNGRTSGKIFVGLVNEDGSINWKYTYSDSVNMGGHYAYSCLTELNDGSIGLLYEDGSTSITYQTYTIQEIAQGAELTAIVPNVTLTDDASNVTVTAPGLTKVTVKKLEDSTPYDGYTASVTYQIELETSAGAYTGKADVKIPYDSAIFGDYDEFIGSVGSDTFTVTKQGSYFVGTVPHFSDVTISARETQELEKKDVQVSVGKSVTFTDETGNYANAANTAPDSKYATMAVTGKDGEVSTITYTEASVTCSTLITSDSTGWTAASGYYYRVDDGNYYPVYAKRSSVESGSFGNRIRTYTYTWGYRVDTSSEITEIGTQETSVKRWESWPDDTAIPTITVYTRSGTEGTLGSTTIVFTGVAEGKTTAIVGNIQYNIEVLGRGGSYTESVSVGATTDISVSDDELAEGETVKWTVSDSTYVGVYGGEGLSATIIGRAQGTSNVIATIYDATGKAVATYTWAVTVNSGSKPNAGSYTVEFSYEVTVYNGTVYYSIDGGTLKKAVQDTSGEGTTYTVQEEDQNVAYASIVWFVKPNDGYAVTTVGADENSKSQFYAIDKENKTFTYGANHSGGRIENFLTEAEEKAMLEEAVALGCDAVFWNSRGSETSHLGANATASGTYVVHCDRLPTITKEIAYLKRGSDRLEYTEGMTALVGDQIYFKIVVTTYDESGTGITYSDAYMKDVMSNVSGTAKLYDANMNELSSIDNYNITSTLNGDGTSGNTHTYYVVYTIQDADLDQELKNDVTLKYTYQSTYSSGSYGGESNAAAQITATTFNPKDIVIDFGLKVKLDFSAAGAHGRYDLASGSANYGDVTVENNVVTYQPNKVLYDVDEVTLVNEKGTKYTFKVYPATTVYYEDTFITNTDFESVGTPGTGFQQAATPGMNGAYPYGYDAYYNSYQNQASNGTQLKSAKAGDTATFSFTGTGVDIYANCGPDTGMVMITVKHGNNVEKMAVVNTAMKNGGTDATKNQKVTAYNVPIVSFDGLTQWEHTVTITHVADGAASGTQAAPVYLDGFRVHGTLSVTDTGVYQDDGENYLNMVELRDQVIRVVLGGQTTDSEQYKNQLVKYVNEENPAQGLKEVKTQILDTETKAVIVSESSSLSNADRSMLTDLIDNGPKNEIYLAGDDTLVFNIGAYKTVQVGAKVLSGTPTCTIGGTSVVSSTDMFYEVTANAGGLVTISVENSGILAVTELKVLP